MWSFVWVVIEALAIHWGRRGRAADAAVLLGFLEHRGLAFGALSEGRADVNGVVCRSGVTNQGGRGAAMTRDDLVDFALLRLGARPVGTTEASVDESVT